MEELELRMEEIMTTDPECTLREVVAELVNKGDLAYEALNDAYIHAAIARRYASVKARVNQGRINAHL